jgi:sterol 14-demethylase
MISGLPVLGSVLEFSKDRAALIRRGYEAHGPVFGFKLGPQPVAALIGSDLHQLFFCRDRQEVGDGQALSELACRHRQCRLFGIA